MIISSLNGVEKSRYAFFDVPIEVGNSLVSLPVLVADGLLVDVQLGANWEALEGMGKPLGSVWGPSGHPAGQGALGCCYRSGPHCAQHISRVGLCCIRKNHFDSRKC